MTDMCDWRGYEDHRDVTPHENDVTKQQSNTTWFENSMVTEPPPIKKFWRNSREPRRHWRHPTRRKFLYWHRLTFMKNRVDTTMTSPNKKATPMIWKQHGYSTPTDQKLRRNSREPTLHWRHPTKMKIPLMIMIDLYAVLCRHDNDVTKQKKTHVLFESSRFTETHWSNILT